MSEGDQPMIVEPLDDFDILLQNPNLNPNPVQKQKSINQEKKNSSKTTQKETENDDGHKFRCGKCLFLPRPGKPKPVAKSSSSRSSSRRSGFSLAAEAVEISRRVSMERFDRESWSLMMKEDYDDEMTMMMLEGSFFDLPVELLRCSVSDVQSPVTAAFVFTESTPPLTDPSSSRAPDQEESVEGREDRTVN